MSYGLAVHPSSLIPPGFIVWKRGDFVIGISNPERRDFWRLFGFSILPPYGCTGMVVSKADFDAMMLESRATPTQPPETQADAPQEQIHTGGDDGR